MKCAQCGTKNSPSDKFCQECGEPLDGDAVREEPGRLQALWGSAPVDLAERMRAASVRAEGERKPVTILFADIVGSTAIAEGLDPEERKEIVAGVHRRVGEAVYRYEGTVAQLLGDGLLAFFGAPTTHEDDPMRAARAGLDMQGSIGEFRRELSGLVENLQMRVGIHTGEVVIGEIGADLHVEYLAIGDAVNTAARLESAAEPGSILISARCARLIGEGFALEDRGEIAVKGKQEAIHGFEVLGTKWASAMRRGIRTEGIPYVGGEHEIEMIKSILARLCSGSRGIVSILGEAGIGKSRLLEEVRSCVCESAGMIDGTLTLPATIRWLEGRALSYGGSLSYWTATRRILDDLGLSEGAPEFKIRVALRERLTELFAWDADEPFPYIGRLLWLTEEGEAQDRIASMDAESVKAQTHFALAYFGKAAGAQPTTLVLEDWHWASPSSVEALKDLMALTDRVPLLMIMAMRVERDHGSWRLRTMAESEYPHRYVELQLKRLSETEADELRGHLLGEGVLPEKLRDPLRGRSEGNPLYPEEIVNHLAENHLIEREGESWHATAAARELGIPETLHGALLARIDGLEEDVRHTLQMASVIGKSFPYSLLRAMFIGEDDLDRHLLQLQRIDLIREQAGLPELEFAFKHSLTQEAVYNSLLLERRREFHLNVGGQFSACSANDARNSWASWRTITKRPVHCRRQGKTYSALRTKRV
jgi:class 3 adenylate cyclase